MDGFHCSIHPCCSLLVCQAIRTLRRVPYLSWDSSCQFLSSARSRFSILVSGHCRSFCSRCTLNSVRSSQERPSCFASSRASLLFLHFRSLFILFKVPVVSRRVFFSSHLFLLLSGYFASGVPCLLFLISSGMQFHPPFVWWILLSSQGNLLVPVFLCSVSRFFVTGGAPYMT